LEIVDESLQNGHLIAALRIGYFREDLQAQIFVYRRAQPAALYGLNRSLIISLLRSGVERQDNQRFGLLDGPAFQPPSCLMLDLPPGP
jgi:hypothetical protein